MISPISGYGSYGIWGMGPGMNTASGSGAQTSAGAQAAGAAVGAQGAGAVRGAEEKKPIVNPGESTEVKAGKKVSPVW